MRLRFRLFVSCGLLAFATVEDDRRLNLAPPPSPPPFSSQPFIAAVATVSSSSLMIACTFFELMTAKQERIIDEMQTKHMQCTAALMMRVVVGHQSRLRSGFRAYSVQSIALTFDFDDSIAEIA